MMRRRSLLAGLLAAGLVALGIHASEGQERVRVDGTVQWIGAAAMQVMTFGGTVAVDLRQADQGAYRGLRAGERVIVDGVVAADRRSVVAYAIWRPGNGIESP
jgi:hypothetical protein